MVVHVQGLAKYNQANRIATLNKPPPPPLVDCNTMEPSNIISTETKLNSGKQKKDAGDRAFRQGDTKEGTSLVIRSLTHTRLNQVVFLSHEAIS